MLNNGAYYYYFMLITHVWITQVHRFWKAKAQHASPTPQLSSSSYIARALQHRAIACGLEHHASARLSRFGAVESAQRFLHLWFMAPDKSTTRSSSEALTSTLQAQEQRICFAARCYRCCRTNHCGGNSPVQRAVTSSRRT